MLVRMVRMPYLPGGLTAIFDDQDDGLVIWVQEDIISEGAARMMERLYSVAVYYWQRRPGEPLLRAV